MKKILEHNSKCAKYYPLTRLASALLVASLAAGNTSAETLQQYAVKCDAAIAEGTPFTPQQVAVPDFNCDAGTLVPTTDNGLPTTNSADGCDRPNVLNNQCDPGSRFQVLRRDPYAVAHCRKQGLGEGTGRYGDIAVIQWNEDNGATCFYQALGVMDGRLVKAPSTPSSPTTPDTPPKWSQSATDRSRWYTPEATANINCAGCHDNGPIIRSPYLAQLKTGPNALPGAGDNTFNRDQPYHFVGEDFASWKVYKVHVQGNTCVNCHRMGANNLGGGGTSLDFGIKATAPMQAAKNPHSPTSPIWMLPGQIIFQQSSADAARAIADCAARKNETPLPNAAGCQITQLSTSSPPVSPVGSLQFSAAAYLVTEEVSSAAIAVRRVGGSTGQVSVDYTTGGGTATDGADYTFTQGTLTWPGGDSANKSFNVPIRDDGDIEGSENINLTLRNPGGTAVLGTPRTAVVTIAASDGGSSAFKCGGQSVTSNCTVNGVAGRPCAGTAGNDVIIGSAAADVIQGLRGNDTIQTLVGNDSICGGEGIDNLRAGGGNDRLFGALGNDRMVGALGRDTCDGGPGRDTAESCEVRRNVP